VHFLCAPCENLLTINVQLQFRSAQSHQSLHIHRTSIFLENFVAISRFLEHEQNFPALHHSSGLTVASCALILLPLLRASKKISDSTICIFFWSETGEPSAGMEGLSNPFSGASKPASRTSRRP
jgi:hypothetical protein